MNETTTQALQVIRTALTGGPLTLAELTAALENQGDGWAARHILKLARAGYLAGEDQHDPDGNYTGCLLALPEARP
ncbi:MAG: hypothetical protein JXB47_12815 [Anaerolineae bacterium]|nr:hypothetical protein [Anaerolineae bacterium]